MVSVAATAASAADDKLLMALVLVEDVMALDCMCCE